RAVGGEDAPDGVPRQPGPGQRRGEAGQCDSIADLLRVVAAEHDPPGWDLSQGRADRVHVPEQATSVEVEVMPEVVIERASCHPGELPPGRAVILAAGRRGSCPGNPGCARLSARGRR